MTLQIHQIETKCCNVKTDVVYQEKGVTCFDRAIKQSVKTTFQDVVSNPRLRLRKYSNISHLEFTRILYKSSQSKI